VERASAAAFLLAGAAGLLAHSAGCYAQRLWDQGGEHHPAMCCAPPPTCCFSLQDHLNFYCTASSLGNLILSIKCEEVDGTEYLRIILRYRGKKCSV